MTLESIGKILLIGGGVALALGVVFLLLARIPILNQLFNLPGDLRIQTENVSCFVPIVSMIVISVVGTILINVILRLINRE
ncbi:MAG TPA: DUF2905 domain-containing protein [Aggregatilineales bacterium]|nr:DUF2905 domain-containing protein [Aggregatilineales bacterium]